MCTVPEIQLRLNHNRGFGLICDNKLAAVLSIILPGNNGTNATQTCSNSLQTNAYYAKVSTNFNWVHGIIGTRTPEYATDGKPISVIPIVAPYESNYSKIDYLICVCFYSMLQISFLLFRCGYKTNQTIKVVNNVSNIICFDSSQFRHMFICTEIKMNK